jgi:hypothetical protein
MLVVDIPTGRTRTETLSKRQATQHGWLPSLLGDGDKGIKIVYVEENFFVLGRLEQSRQNKNLLYRQEGPLSFVI